MAMVTTSSAITSSLLPATATVCNRNQQPSFLQNRSHSSQKQKRAVFKVQAAKLPAGVELPKKTPTFKPPVAGFTRVAEIWNSRACMIGLIGTFIVELILNKGILQIIGVEVGKGLDLPL
ncbi:OLC1v1034910C1 [Oldenlandia corymbosa var. corymbosa]|uniref:OLC1v1034910C1 n=1 Tax=Oldenlandia corymbosa var. corymbosa TaxID=529605 RepID=A0AAV1CUC4_OLDCO|nr:OLC1v1034910C1 [Oldenlandia corymbosa var. corymbosa]